MGREVDLGKSNKKKQKQKRANPELVFEQLPVLSHLEASSSAINPGISIGNVS